MTVPITAVRRYQRQLSVYRDRTAAILVAAWDNLPGYDVSDLKKFEEVTAVPLAGAKVAAVTLSAAFFATVLGIRPVGVRADEVAVTPDLRGVFTSTWHALSMGRPYEEALSVGRSTASANGMDFVERSARRTGDVAAEKSGLDVRWTRVPDANACEWCLTVAGQSYRTAESADFGHARDACSVVPDI